MNEHIKHIAEQYWERVTRGELQDDIVRSLKEDGHSILESIATIMVLFNMGLREARELIETHPAWQKEREAPPTLQRGIWPSWNDIEAARKMQREVWPSWNDIEVAMRKRAVPFSEPDVQYIFEEQTGETNEQAAQAQDDQKPQEVPDEQ